MKFSKEKEESIIKDYLNGKNTVEIAKKWNTYNTSIRRVLLRYGITLRSSKEVQARVKINPFKDNDELSDYFLGILLTDGCIYKGKYTKSVSLSLKDKDMVCKFRDFLSPQAKVSEILQKKFNTYMYSISVRSDMICDWLMSKGNFIDKSNKCDIYVPLNWNILRGIFDGDGFWNLTNKGTTIRWGVCGKSLIFIQKIQEFLFQNGIKSYITEKLGDHSLYYVNVYKTVDSLKIAKLMYNDAHIFLVRKYETWHLFEETLREKFPKFKEGAASSNPEPSRNSNNYLYNKKDGRFIMEGAETIMGLLNII